VRLTGARTTAAFFTNHVGTGSNTVLWWYKAVMVRLSQKMLILNEWKRKSGSGVLYTNFFTIVPIRTIDDSVQSVPKFQ